MTAQIANGGYKIKPKIIVNDDPLTLVDAKNLMERQSLQKPNTRLFND